MTKSTLPIIIIFFIVSCQDRSRDYNDVVEVYENYSELEALINSDSDKTWVVNFWATTCPPCLKEMPHFAELEKQYDADRVKVLLISLDETRHLESRVMPFVERHKITPEVILLADQNYSAWTDEIDPSWFGALPATLILKGDERNFRFGAYETYEELTADLEKIIK